MRRNFLTGIYIAILLFTIYILQLYLINPRELFGIKPNLILIVVIVVSLWYGVHVGGISSLLIGFLTDILFGSNNGMFTISYTIVGIIVGILNDNYRKESKMSLVYVTIIATFSFEIVQFFQYILLYKVGLSLVYLIKQIVISSLLNIVIVYIVYSLMYNLSEYIEERITKKSSGF